MNVSTGSAPAGDRPGAGTSMSAVPRLPDAPEPGWAYVESLPDLIDATEYPDHPDGRLVRIQIKVTDSGVEVLGDAFRPAEVEALLAALGGGPTEQMLCG